MIYAFDPGELRFGASKFTGFNVGKEQKSNRTNLYIRMLNKYHAKKYKFIVVDDDREFEFRLNKL